MLFMRDNMDLSPRGDVRKAGRFCVVEECVGKTQKGDPRRQQTPACVTFKFAYDRSTLIEDAIASVRKTLIEVMIVVAFVVLLFLFNWRSALSIIIQIPITIAVSFILLNAFGLSSNIMSLTGIALAIGVIVDNGIIMSENAYRSLSEWQNSHSANPSP